MVLELVAIFLQYRDCSLTFVPSYVKLRIRSSVLQKSIHDHRSYLSFSAFQSVLALVLEILLWSTGIVQSVYRSVGSFVLATGYGSSILSRILRVLTVALFLNLVSALVRLLFLQLARVFGVQLATRIQVNVRNILTFVGSAITLCLVGTILYAGAPFVTILWTFGCGVVFISLLPVMLTPQLRGTIGFLPSGYQDAISVACSQFKFSPKHITVFQASSSHARLMYCTGFSFFGFLHISDMAVEALDPPALAALLCHELAHIQLWHPLKHFLISAFSSIVDLYLVFVFIQHNFFSILLGFGPDSTLELLLALFFLEPIFKIVQFVANVLSHQLEFSSDRLASEAVGESLYSQVLTKLLLLSPSEAFPSHRFYACLHDTHPSLIDRLAVFQPIIVPNRKPPHKRLASRM